MRIDSASLVIIAMFLWTIIPSAVQALGAGRVGVRTGLEVPTSDSFEMLSLITQWMMLAIIGLVVLIRLPRFRFQRWQFIFVGPWIAQLISSLVMERSISLTGVVYPLVGIIVATLDNRTKALRTLGILTALLALGSLVMAALAPGSALLIQDTGTDKSPLGSFLAGPLGHPNTLGQTLALGLPFVSLIPRRGWKWSAYACCAGALFWTGSRSALVAAGVALALALLWRYRHQSKGGLRSLTSVCLVVGYYGVVLVGPVLVLTSTEESFSGRGQIWSGSLAKWTESPIIGNGPHIYRLLATQENQVGYYAFHGHNAFVDIAITCGLLGVIALLCLYLLLLKRSWRLACSGGISIAVWAPLFVSLGWFEVQTGFFLLGSLSWIVWVPLALMLSDSMLEKKTKSGVQISRNSPWGMERNKVKGGRWGPSRWSSGPINGWKPDRIDEIATSQSKAGLHRLRFGKRGGSR